MTPPEPCDLCRNTSFETIALRDRHGRPLKTVLCQHCGLVRHAELPSEQELAEFYSRSYRRQYHGENIPGPRRVMRAWINGERIARQVAPLLLPGGRILEIGAGIGCTVKVFEQAGFQASGIDPGGDFVGYSRSRLKTQVTVGSLNGLKPDGRYDAVLLVHVIEHLRSPVKALKHIHGLLKPDGRLYVECPNLLAPFAWRQRLFHFAHIHNFVPTTLRQAGLAAGFIIQQQFTDEHDPNLQVLFRRCSQTRLHVDPDNVKRTRDVLERSDFLRYHLRPRYVTDRVRKVGSYMKEYLLARHFVARLTEECASRPKARPTGGRAFGKLQADRPDNTLTCSPSS